MGPGGEADSVSRPAGDDGTLQSARHEALVVERRIGAGNGWAMLAVAACDTPRTTRGSLAPKRGGLVHG